MVWKKYLAAVALVACAASVGAQTKTVVRTVERLKEGKKWRLIIKNDSFDVFFIDEKIVNRAEWPKYASIMDDMRFSAYASPPVVPTAAANGDKVSIEEDVFVEKAGGESSDVQSAFTPKLKAALLKDKLIRSNKANKIELSDKLLIINGIKQKKAVSQKYINLYYKETGTKPCTGCSFSIKLVLK